MFNYKEFNNETVWINKYMDIYIINQQCTKNVVLVSLRNIVVFNYALNDKFLKLPSIIII